MSNLPNLQPKTLGATVPDLLLRTFEIPFLVIQLFLLLVNLTASIAFGYVKISWGDNGIKLSQGSRGASASDINIAGTWRGEAKDLSASDRKLIAKYTYTFFGTDLRPHHVCPRGKYILIHPRLTEMATGSTGQFSAHYRFAIFTNQKGGPHVSPFPISICMRLIVSYFSFCMVTAASPSASGFPLNPL